MFDEKYQKVNDVIEIILNKVRKLPEVIEAKKVKKDEELQRVKILVYHFIGDVMESMIPQRFSKQKPGERDLLAWLNRNEAIDFEKDYIFFISGFIGQFYIVEKLQETI